MKLLKQTTPFPVRTLTQIVSLPQLKNSDILNSSHTIIQKSLKDKLITDFYKIYKYRYPYEQNMEHFIEQFSLIFESYYPTLENKLWLTWYKSKNDVSIQENPDFLFKGNAHTSFSENATTNSPYNVEIKGREKVNESTYGIKSVSLYEQEFKNSNIISILSSINDISITNEFNKFVYSFENLFTPFNLDDYVEHDVKEWLDLRKNWINTLIEVYNIVYPYLLTLRKDKNE